MSQLKAFDIKDHSHHDLHAIVTFLFVLTAFRFGVARTDPGKMRIAKILQQHRAIQTEQFALALAQMLFDRVAVMHQSIAHPVIAMPIGLHRLRPRKIPIS